jgi:hypothetical protein
MAPDRAFLSESFAQPLRSSTARRDTGRAMSSENVESLRQGLEAFNRRDRAAWLALCDLADRADALEAVGLRE